MLISKKSSRKADFFIGENMISEAQQKVIMQNALEIIKAASPIDTGNLRHNAIRLESKGRGVWEIYVNEDIAPYMPYTNERWTSPKWNGKKNPNERWWDDVCERVAVFIAQQLGGTLE